MAKNEDELHTEDRIKTVVWQLYTEKKYLDVKATACTKYATPRRVIDRVVYHIARLVDICPRCSGMAAVREPLEVRL